MTYHLEENMDKKRNIFEETVFTLKEDALSLQKKFKKLQGQDDFRGAIDAMRLLKDTLSLIKEYDWNMMFSEYKADDVKQIAIWEQNHCGDIRNYKKYNVSDNESMSSNKWEILLEPFIDSKQTMLYNLSLNYDDKNRATGKSTAIEKLAMNYDLPILTSSFRAKEFNKRLSLSQYKNNKYRACSNLAPLYGIDTDIILIDECDLSSTQLDDLNRNHILVGFIRK